MGRSAQEMNIESAASIAAPVDEVWDVITKTRPVKKPFPGVEEITFRPENAKTIQEGMDVRLKIERKIGIVTVRGLVRIRINDVNVEERYFTVSVIEAPLDLQGDATISLSPDANDDSRTELLFVGSFTVSRLLSGLVSEDRVQRSVDAIMPKIDGMIASDVRRSRYGSNEPAD